MGKYYLSTVFLHICLLISSQIYADPKWDTPLTSDYYIEDIALEGDYIWCATRGGVIRYNYVTGDTITYTTDDGLLDTRILSIAVDQNGVKWFGSSHGLTSFKMDEWTTYPAEEIGVDENLNTASNIDVLFIDTYNNALFGSNIGMHRFDGETFHVIPHIRPQSITSDLDNNIWVLDSHHGAIHFISIGDYSVSTYNFPYLDYPLFFQTTNGILYDSSNTLWIGGFDGILNISLEDNNPDDWDEWRLYNDGRYPYSVNSIIEDNFGNIWISDLYAFYKYNNGVLTQYLYVDTNPNANSMVDDEYERIWGVSGNRLIRLTPEYVVSVSESITAPLALDPPHPNPFNPQTTLSFTLPEAGFARLAVYHLGGQLVRELAAEDLPAGRHEIVWDSRDANGAAVASGVYIARLATGGRSAVRKVTLVR